MSREYPSLGHMLAAWNEPDLSAIERHLAKAVSSDVEFVDPNNAVRGVEGFLQMVREFRTRYPHAQCLRMSAIDAHHDRARYHWRVVIDKSAFIDGMDCVQFDADGLVRRVDGFFGILSIDKAA